MNICMVCAWYEVGMRHYSFTVIKHIYDNLHRGHNFKVVLVLRNHRDDYPELKEIENLDLEVLVIKNPVINVLSKIFPYFLDNYVYKVSKRFNADLLYILYEGVSFKYTKLLKSHQKILYTLHDLVPHEKNISSLKDKLLSNLEDKRRAHLLKESDYVLTNSYHQYQELLKDNTKNAFFCSMPTLINKHISNGNLNIKELIGVGYVLFFGRIDKYKGLDVLIKTHLKSKLNYKLVIAGSGKFWFDIPVNDNLVIINRYIDDSELNKLFSNATLAVMPYTSITQTSLVSIPFYFKCPVILSDINEFVELSSICGSLTCNFENVNDYKEKITCLYNDEQLRNEIVKKQFEYYNLNYDPHKFANNMQEVFDRISN